MLRKPEYSSCIPCTVENAQTLEPCLYGLTASSEQSLAQVQVQGRVRELTSLKAYLESTGQKLVLHLQVVALMNLGLEGFI